MHASGRMRKIIPFINVYFNAQLDLILKNCNGGAQNQQWGHYCLYLPRLLEKRGRMELGFCVPGWGCGGTAIDT